MSKTYIVKQGADDVIEVVADKVEQDKTSTRVTFFNADGSFVASFLNVTAWYPKPLPPAQEA